MNPFECCQYCKPPKRYPGCSGKCPEHAKGRELLAQMKEAERKRKSIRPAKTDYLNNAVWRSKH